MLLASSSSATQHQSSWSGPSSSTIYLLHTQSFNAIRELHQIHARAVTTGLIRRVSVAAKLLSLCSSPPIRRLDYASRLLLLLDEQSHHPYLWNTLIRAYSDSNRPLDALLLYSEMLHQGVQLDKFTYPWVLKACAHLLALKEGEQIHAQIVKSPKHLSFDVFVLNTLINLYVKCSQFDAANRVFDKMPHRDVVSWNAMIGGCDPLLFFCRMLGNGVLPDRFSFTLVLKACTSLTAIREGLQIHSWISKSEFQSDVFVQNALIHMYSRCVGVQFACRVFDLMPQKDAVAWNTMIDGHVKSGDMEAAQDLFDQMPERCLASWNAMVDGYAKAGNIEVALRLFDAMPERDSVSWNAMIDGYAKWGLMEGAHELFMRMPQRDVISWANMIDGYSKIGSIDIARDFFEQMPQRDSISWNVMLGGYVQNGQYKDAIELFHMMQVEGVKPNQVTLVTVLSAIASLGALEEGKWVHNHIDKNQNQFQLDGILGAGIIDMYSKCGSIESGLRVFMALQKRSINHWNAIIGGLAMHGLGHQALQLFSEMQRLSFKPDDITFIAVLSACSHAGLVNEGIHYFESMSKEYNIEPKLQHYGCMVDIFGRAGLLEEAKKFIEEMPIEPSIMVWRSLLGACRNHGNIEIGQWAGRCLIELAPFESSSYVLLSNLYANASMWDDASTVRMMMRARDVKKIPGCSWIEVHGVVHEFLVGDKSHPEVENINRVLKKLALDLKSAGYVLGPIPILMDAYVD
ncbi:pentatricopeptide repeat-containing protein At2g45350, chloroplastic [Amborella trichopoda]|uniref:pentatricopeptide repeat-containing protein At2g45350, chloroplastic n=1 Tax=Amborella trichopoda TaxID=13333 RepID=UPI0005D3BE5D|nr:pentatricopeptide repeat-containing protein At2g45350, chloroplastic [Amborella trichopoda]|eukprot:XP_011628333.1 pentatricopeptide repeat-containing protein At2g45350, chloroplastic [Amborella trichopoda]